MKSFSYTIQDKQGVHARPANKLIRTLSVYKSKVIIKYGDQEANAKSIINLMGLGLSCNSTVDFIFEGEDEDKACEEVQSYLKQESF